MKTNKIKQNSSRPSKHRAHSISQRRAQIKKTVRLNQPAHKRILLHPSAILMLLCVGVLLVGWTYQVVAETISSVIEAPPLTSAATIDSPADGSTLTTMPTEISGYCPTNSYVELDLNNDFDGVAWCTTNNSYSIETSLFAGTNSLAAQDYNSTGLIGPASQAITIIYSPPQPITRTTPEATTPQSSQANNNTKLSQPPNKKTTSHTLPLLLATNYQFKTFSVNTTFSWQISAQGGIPPYKVLTEWGDGTSSTLSLTNNATFTISHHYQKANYYPVIIKITDSQANTDIIQLAALINYANGQSPFIQSSNGNQQTGSTFTSVLSSLIKKHMILTIPAYLIVALMVFSFWLGERKEVELLLTKARKHK